MNTQISHCPLSQLSRFYIILYTYTVVCHYNMSVCPCIADNDEHYSLLLFELLMNYIVRNQCPFVHISDCVPCAVQVGGGGGGDV